MTRKSRREIEREVRDLSDRRGDDEEWFTVACEHDDGTLTTPDGEPIPADADPVLIIPWHVARTWS